MTSPRNARTAPPGDLAPRGPGGDGIPRARVYLLGGEIAAAAAPTEVTTVLGSCVAVCLFSAATRVGGLNHFLLPRGPDDGTGRVGEPAMRLLLERVLALGARRQDLRAKVFGGASTLGAHATGRTLGDQNAELAVRTLAAEGIPVLGGEVGGTRGRKLVFHTDTGDAWLLVL